MPARGAEHGCRPPQPHPGALHEIPHAARRGCAALVVIAARRARRPRRLDRLRQGRQRLALDPRRRRQYQVTYTGGYTDVSQADDGTLIALKGVRLHQLDRDGNVLADFDTPVSDTRPAGSRVFYGPFDPAISPDGTKVAYTYYYMTQSQNPNCFPPDASRTINEGGTGYSHADRQTGWDEPGLGHHSGWRYPAWADDDTTSCRTRRTCRTATSSSTRSATAHAGTRAPLDHRHRRGQPARRRRRHHARQAQARVRHRRERLDPDALLRAVFPTVFDGRRAPAGSDPFVCYRYSDADRREVRHADVLARRRATSRGATVTASASSTCRTSPRSAAARSTARRSARR